VTVVDQDEKIAARLRQKRCGIEQVELLVQGLNDLLTEERKAYFDLLAEVVGKSANSICCGTRTCETSPTGTCVYEYTAEDICLFCGLPNELL
jgi:hypothetical protein